MTPVIPEVFWYLLGSGLFFLFVCVGIAVVLSQKKHRPSKTGSKPIPIHDDTSEQEFSRRLQLINEARYGANMRELSHKTESPAARAWRQANLRKKTLKHKHDVPRRDGSGPLWSLTTTEEKE